jgi:hypothetical protein
MNYFCILDDERQSSGNTIKSHRNNTIIWTVCITLKKKYINGVPVANTTKKLKRNYLHAN